MIFKSICLLRRHQENWFTDLVFDRKILHQQQRHPGTDKASADLGSIPVGLFPRRVLPATQIGYSSGYPARYVTLYGQRRDWLAWCQYTVTK